jgi:hypothetical protein
VINPAGGRMSKLSQKIIREIIADFTDRRGLRQEWEQIDKDVIREIKKTWTGIIEKHLSLISQEKSGVMCRAPKTFACVRECLECRFNPFDN